MSKKKLWAGLAASVAVVAAGAGGLYWHKTADVRRVMEGAAASLKDPESARFEGVFFNPVERVGCGYVNAKNAYGAYVGARKFYFVEENGHVEFAPPEADGVTPDERVKQLTEMLEFQKTYTRLCFNREAAS